MAYATGYKSFGPDGPEKIVIESAAKQKGFRGLPAVPAQSEVEGSEIERSDFIRAGAMALTK